MSENNGKTNQDILTATVRQYPGLTAKEIADLADLNPGTASGLASKMEQDGLLLAEGRPKRYTLAPESAPTKPKSKPIAWDPPRVARAWESVLGLKLSHADVRLALDIAQRASTRRSGS